MADAEVEALRLGDCRVGFGSSSVAEVASAGTGPDNSASKARLSVLMNFLVDGQYAWTGPGEESLTSNAVGNGLLCLSSMAFSLA